MSGPTMLPPCFKALSGSPVPPGEGPSSSAQQAKRHPIWPCQLHGPVQPFPVVPASATPLFLLPRKPSQIPPFHRGSSHCQEGLHPAVPGSLYSRPLCVLQLHACSCHNSRTCVQILCEQACMVPRMLPLRKAQPGTGAAQVCLDFPKPLQEQAL